MNVESIIQLIYADKLLAKLREKIEAGLGTFKDTTDYCNRSAELLGRLFSENVLSMSDVERITANDTLLKDRYKYINDLLDKVQRTVDKKQGINIRPQHAPFNQERADQIGRALTDKTVSEETIQRRAGSAPATMTRAMQDDYVEENAKFRSDAGLKTYLVRVTDGDCCEWCTKVAGRYEYGTEPHDIYRRHDNCGCSVTYENGRQRQNVWTKKTWEVPAEDAGAPEPVRLTKEQAAELQAKNMPRGVANYSKDIDIFNDYGAPENADFTGKDIIENLKKSSIGNEILEYAPSMDKRIVLNYSIAPLDYAKRKIYGEEDGGLITIYMRNCEDAERAARTIIHECTHKRYGIGQSQWAECVCFAQELKHKYRRDILTIAEKRRIIKAVKDGYPEYNWRKGGMIYGKRKDRI